MILRQEKIGTKKTITQQSGQLLGVSVQNLQYQQIAMLAILQILAEK